jgi:DNA-binding MarR family transcriptional regulator/ribosomal protein S18 acetylase RimI-like enzyme
MSSLHDYGELLLASRLRKVSETLYAGVDAVYRNHGVELPSRCFPILFLLRDHGRLGISDLAQRLGQTHPAVSQMSRKLLAHGVVREWPDPGDERRRLLALSPRGAALMRKLEPVWSAIVAAVRGLDGADRLSRSLQEVDAALAARGFGARIEGRLAEGRPAAEIIPYAPRHAADFKRLNLAWLKKFFRVEPIDEEVLSHPDRLIVAGGSIFFARVGRRIVGTCALLNAGKGRYELSKMAVDASVQGRGIGRLLLHAAIAAFEARGGACLYLESSLKLTPALTLYESVGFVHTPRPEGPSHYDRADVYMVFRPERRAAGSG